MSERRRPLVNAIVAAHYVTTTYDYPISPITVRSWASRGRIGNHGTGPKADHYDLDEIDTYIRKRLHRD